MDREELAATSMSVAGAIETGGLAKAQASATTSNEKFSMRFATHLGLLTPDKGMFRHHAGDDPVDQVRFIAERGFTAMEYNWMKIRDLRDS